MIIFLYGKNTYNSRQKLRELKDKFIREIDPSKNNIIVLDGKTVNIEQINEKVSPRSLLVKKRMIIVEDIFLNKDKDIFLDLFNHFKAKKHTSGDNIIVFWDSSVATKKTSYKVNTLHTDASGKEKALTKKQLLLFNLLLKQYAQEFKLLSNTEAASWVKKQVANHGGNISHQAVQILVSLIGNDLWQLNNEINKLLNYKLGLKPKLIPNAPKNQQIEIYIKDIEQLVKGNFDENIFALTDAISNKNNALAVKLLEEQYEAGLTDGYLISMIIRQFKILLRIRQALDSGLTGRKINSSLKLHPFIVQKGINQVRNFSLTALKNILKQMIKIDYHMKTGQANAKIMLNLFLSKI
ncbi:DNA polymerase III subunit delta [Patescibacteria group bacterium]|nr:DNA polymerase III subunit delta [Patescibacteria group bacterium]